MCGAPRRLGRDRAHLTHPPLGPATTTTLRFEKGYIEQAFARAHMRESIRHGPENELYLQRLAAQHASTGKTTGPENRSLDLGEFTSPAPSMSSVHESLRSGPALMRGRERARTPRERLRLLDQRILF
jgi:hypothetical protein